MLRKKLGIMVSAVKKLTETVAELEDKNDLLEQKVNVNSFLFPKRFI